MNEHIVFKTLKQVAKLGLKLVPLGVDSYRYLWEGERPKTGHANREKKFYETHKPFNKPIRFVLIDIKEQSSLEIGNKRYFLIFKYFDTHLKLKGYQIQILPAKNWGRIKPL